MTYNGAGKGFEGDPEGPKFYVGANNGFRSWEVVTTVAGAHANMVNRPEEPKIQWALRSLVMAYAWNDGINGFQCLRSPYTQRAVAGDERCAYPSTDCACGFYAYYNRDKFWTGLSQHASTPRVWGLMEGWGRCVVGDDGFRSEFAMVSALVVHKAGLPLPWLGKNNLTPAAGMQVIRSVVETLFPNTPVFDSTDAMLKAIPLHGRPR